MRYGNRMASAPMVSKLEKGTNASKSCFFKPQKTRLRRLFRYFSLYLSQISEAQKFNILTSNGRKCAAR